MLSRTYAGLEQDGVPPVEPGFHQVGGVAWFLERAKGIGNHELPRLSSAWAQ